MGGSLSGVVVERAEIEIAGLLAEEVLAGEPLIGGNRDRRDLGERFQHEGATLRPRGRAVLRVGKHAGVSAVAGCPAGGTAIGEGTILQTLEAGGEHR